MIKNGDGTADAPPLTITTTGTGPGDRELVVGDPPPGATWVGDTVESFRQLVPMPHTHPVEEAYGPHDITIAPTGSINEALDQAVESIREVAKTPEGVNLNDGRLVFALTLSKLGIEQIGDLHAMSDEQRVAVLARILLRFTRGLYQVTPPWMVGAACRLAADVWAQVESSGKSAQHVLEAKDGDLEAASSVPDGAD